MNRPDGRANPPFPVRTPPHRPARWLRLTLAVVLAGIFILVLVPWLASPWVTSVVNRRLAGMPGYTAHIASLRLEPWRLTVEMEGFALTEKSGQTDGPVLAVTHGYLTVLPGALLRGKLSGHGGINDSELYIIQDEPKPGKEDSEEDKVKKTKERAAKARRWQDLLEEKLSVEMTRFEIVRTKIHFVDRSMAGNPGMLIEDFHLIASHLNSRKKEHEDSPTSVVVTGRFAGGGLLRAEAGVTPQKQSPEFTASLEVKELALPPLHDFLKAYSNVDVSKGTFEVYVEVAAKNGHYTGYLKPFFRDLEFKALPDPNKNVLQNTATKVASAVTNLLKNDEDKIATKAPFEGDFKDNRVDVWRTVENLLRNAFVQSLREGFDGQKPTG